MVDDPGLLRHAVPHGHRNGPERRADLQVEQMGVERDVIGLPVGARADPPGGLPDGPRAVPPASLSPARPSSDPRFVLVQMCGPAAAGL